MLLVILGLGLIILGIGLYLTYKGIYEEWIYFTLNGVGSVIAILAVIVMIPLGIMCSTETTIDERISLYEEENARIEQQVAETVNHYMTYEQETFDKIVPDDIDPTFIVTMFPELNSSELVKSQIEIYQYNNMEIKSLKEKKLIVKVYKWWLYFGG